MANAEQLEILKQGVEVWNKWREENKDVKIDLSNADLSDSVFVSTNFSNANLNQTDFSGSNLSNSNFSKAELIEAYLIGAELENVNLFGAFLNAADISGANLTNANLCKANLYGVDFSNANLAQAAFIEATLSAAIFFGTDIANTQLISANLSRTVFIKCNFLYTDLKGSVLNYTVFGLTDLSRVKNLDKIVASGECSIDFQTIRDSRNLPKTFLRKIGLPENYINYLPDFFEEKPIRMHPAFLSHSWHDKPFATKLYEALIKRNVLVWYDERKLVPGDDIRDGINKGIDLYDKFILVCSKNSLKESWWVDKELNRALQKEERLFKEKGRQINTIIPITIDDYVFKEWDGAKRPDIHRYLIGDFKDWQDDAKFEKALDALIKALNADRGEEKVPSYL